MELTASVMVVLPLVIGLASFEVTMVAVHPGCFFTATEANGWSTGMVTVRAMVSALADPLETLNVNFEKEPAVAVLGVTVTWAEATPAPTAKVRPVTAVTVHGKLMFRVGFGRGVLALAGAVAASLLSAGSAAPAAALAEAKAAPAAFKAPKIGHVWAIILENKSYEATFTGLNQNDYL